MDNKLAFGIIEKYLINSSTPSQGLRELTQEDWFHNYPFIILAKLKYTEQSPVHHPEGNVWNHTCLWSMRPQKGRLTARTKGFLCGQRFCTI